MLGYVVLGCPVCLYSCLQCWVEGFSGVRLLVGKDGGKIMSERVMPPATKIDAQEIAEPFRQQVDQIPRYRRLRADLGVQWQCRQIVYAVTLREIL